MVGAPCQTGRPGIRATGTLQRTADEQLACIASRQPRQEVCSRVDDDCDGRVNEGALCPSAANAQVGCVQGTCAVITCDAGFGDRDGDADNGCETDRRSDPGNCGGCGRLGVGRRGPASIPGFDGCVDGACRCMSSPA